MENKEIKEVAENTEKKVMNILQFAHRAGKLKFGISMLKTLNRKIKIIIISKDISETNLKKIQTLDNKRTIILSLGTMESIGDALGRVATSVVFITDTNFANGIVKLMTY